MMAGGICLIAAGISFASLRRRGMIDAAGKSGRLRRARLLANTRDLREIGRARGFAVVMRRDGMSAYHDARPAERACR